ncbi:siderophore-interacting protein [Microbacterium sp. gxy059]|uniref:siderophore-interacting protein n=1 Tax=Microbacterium sp. gxy059 TaxID=2957199 RepID=UPI003D974540
MSNIAVTHAESGLIEAEVIRAERVTPHMMRITLGGPDVGRFAFQGFDQWFRLALPVAGGGELRRLPQKFGLGGSLRWLMMPKGARPVIRNYTVRDARSDPPEIDVDFVVHGDAGVAGPWAARAQPGDRVALIDQGCGWTDPVAGRVLLVADESGLPAVAGILRDLPRTARGRALIELFDARDEQPTGAPDGVEVTWLVRGEGEAPGSLALPALRELGEVDPATVAFCVGEQALATGARRHLVREAGLPKGQVTFSGYWRLGRAAI